MRIERYVRARLTDEALLDQSLLLLRQAFPPEERREDAAQRALMQSGAISLWAARGEDHALCALMTLHELPDGLFLEHFAVQPTLRSQGLGGQMLDALLAEKGRLLLEAELPETELAARRLRFYVRHGLTVHDHPYEQPPYRPGHAPIPMRLLSAPGFSSRAAFDRAVADIYRTVYQITR